MKTTSSSSRNWFRLIGWIVACIVVVYGIAGFVIVPIVAQKKLPPILSDALNAEVSIDDIDFNPFSLRAAVNGLSVVMADGSSFVEADQVSANVQLSSVLRMGAVVKAVEIKAPKVNLVRRADGSFNFSDLAGSGDAESKAKKEDASEDEEKKGSPVYFYVSKFKLTDGQVRFSDETSGFKTTIDPVSVLVKNLSSKTNSLADLEIGLQTLAEESIACRGTLGLFPLSADLQLDAQSLSVPHYAPFYKDLTGLDIKDGRVDVSADILYPQPSPASENPLVKNGRISIRSLLINDPDTGNSAVDIGQFTVAGVVLDLEGRSVDVESVVTKNGKILCEKAKSGVLNFSKLAAASAQAEGSSAKPEPEKPESAEPEPSSAPWKVHLGLINVDGYSVAYTDAVPDQPVSLGLDGITVWLYDIALKQDHLTEWSFASLARPGIISARGGFQVNPVAADFEFRVSEVDLAGAAPYARDFGADIQKGIVHAAGNVAVELQPEGLFAKYKGEARIDDFFAADPETGKEFLKFSHLGFEDIRVQMDDLLSVSLNRILLREPKFSAGMAQDGSLLPSLLAGKKSENKKPEEQKGLDKSVDPEQSGVVDNKADKSTDKNDAGLAYEVTVNRIDLENGQVLFTDQRFSPEISGSLNPINLNVSDFRLGQKQAVFDFRLMDLGLAGAGPLAVPYGADLHKGLVNVSGNVKAGMGKDDSVTRFQGEARIEDFAAADPKTGKRFFSIDLLGLENINVESADSTVMALNRILIQKPVVTLGLEKDGTLFPSVLAGNDKSDSNGKTDEAQAQEKSAFVQKATTGPDKETEPAKPGFQADIRQIEMKQGGLAFFDRSVTPEFSTRLEPIDASISDVQFDPQNVTDFTINGLLDGQSPFTVSGRIRPLAFKDMTLTDVKFDNIEMPMFTPYFGKYLGYEIQKGKLHLDLGYQVDSLKLDGKNMVRLDQFYLGNTVQSEDAISLPLKLALALLRDRAGKIDLNVPVEGDMNNPKFRLGGVIFDAFVNILKKLVTSPFSALASLVPGAEELSFVDFAPGSQDITDKGRDKLEKLATALYDRPSLRLIIRPGADPAQDRRAFQETEMQKLILEEAGLKDVPDVDLSGQIGQLPEEDYEKHLRAACKSADVNIEDLSVEEMENALRQSFEVPDSRLMQLAEKRGTAVRDVLFADDRIEAGRVFMENAEINDQPRVDFELEAE